MDPTLIPAQIMIKPERASEVQARFGLDTPVNGDATARGCAPFMPSLGNLWAQPGVVA